jgi:hypothetical protein
MKIILKNEKDDKTDELELPEEKLNSFQIIEIKELLSNLYNHKLDTIFILNSNSNYFFKDCDKPFNNNLNEHTMNFTYQIIINNNVKVCIDYFQNDIDKIYLDICTFSSIYMLKYIISKRLGMDIKQQGLIDITTQKQLNDNHILQDILEGDIKSVKCHRDQLKFQLYMKTPNKLTMGLDFSFTLLKNVKKIDFDTEAPSYREVTDGLSLFCICRNRKCKIYGDIFTKEFGYGTFYIIDEIHLTKCPICKCGNVEAKNIGFVNCEWNYKGTLLRGSKTSAISGDGITVDNKLYVLNETNLSWQFENLEMSVKKTRTKYKVYDNEEAVESLNVFGDLQVIERDIEEIEDCREFGGVSVDKREDNFKKICSYADEFRKGTISEVIQNNRVKDDYDLCLIY